MEAITYTQARAQLAKTMERVCDDRAPIIPTGNSGHRMAWLGVIRFDRGALSGEQVFFQFPPQFDGQGVEIPRLSPVSTVQGFPHDVEFLNGLTRKLETSGQDRRELVLPSVEGHSQISVENRHPMFTVKGA